MRNELLARIDDDKLRGVVKKIFEIADGFEARRKSIASNPALNEYGRLAAAAAELKHDFGPALRVARKPLLDAREAIVARKAKIVLPAIDPADVVGQLQRMERRSCIAALGMVERTKLLFDSGADERFVDAVLAEPPELSGMPKDRHNDLRDRRLHQLHGPEMAELEHDEIALAEAEAAASVATNDMKTSLDPKLDTQTFDKVVSQAIVPWLVDRGGSIAVVKIDDKGQATYPEASALEMRTGKFFKNQDEYNAQAA